MTCDLRPIDFIILYLESSKSDRLKINKLRVLNNGKYDYSLLGAVADSYLLYRQMNNLQTASRWEEDFFISPNKRRTNKGMPEVVHNWMTGNSIWGVGYQLANYIYALNKYSKGLCFSQVAQLIKVQFLCSN